MSTGYFQTRGFQFLPLWKSIWEVGYNFFVLFLNIVCLFINNVKMYDHNMHWKQTNFSVFSNCCYVSLWNSRENIWVFLIYSLKFPNHNILHILLTIFTTYEIVIDYSYFLVWILSMQTTNSFVYWQFNFLGI